MRENVSRERNLMDYIEDLARPELTHNYPDELARIREYICQKQKEIGKETQERIARLETEIETLKVSNKALAYYIKSREI